MKICLCGSAKFEKAFKWWNKMLSLNGHIVYSLSVYPSDESGKSWYTPEQKIVLDQVHMNKILYSEAVVIINEAEYIGESTRNELNYALSRDKRIYSVEPLDCAKSAYTLLETIPDIK